MYSFNLEANNWEAEPDLIRKQTYHASLAIGQKIYVACGHEGEKNLNSIKIMDLSERSGLSPSKSWKKISFEQFTPRSMAFLSILQINFEIIVIHGFILLDLKHWTADYRWIW